MLKELGNYKNRLGSLFVNNDNICKLLLGQNYESEFDDLDAELDKYVIPHLYIPGTITETKAYIMYDVEVNKTYGHTKEMKITIECICHKDITKYREKPTGYPGLRYDVLAEFIEEVLCPDDENANNQIIKKFGIGSLDLQNVKLFLTDKFIGRVLIFTVPDFR